MKHGKNWMQPSRRLLTGLTCLSLLAFLPACATRIEYKFIPPPADLLKDCPVTDAPLATNGDIAKALQARNLDLTLCNSDKAGLREWTKAMSK